LEPATLGKSPPPEAETPGRKDTDPSLEPKECLKVSSPEGTEYTIPQPRHGRGRGRYIVFHLQLDLTKDWNIIQLIYSLPPRTRSRMVRDMLRIVVNAAHIWSERVPMLQLKHGKKLTPEQRRKLLRTKLGMI